MYNKIFRLLGWLLLTLSSSVSHAATYHIGVLAYPHFENHEYNWMPLEAYLSSQFPDDDFNISAQTKDVLSLGIQQGTYDFVLTSPTHFIQLKANQPQVQTIATRRVRINEQTVSQMGGVIVALSQRQDIKTMADILDKEVIASSPFFLGDYLAQLNEIATYGISTTQFDIHFTGKSSKELIDTLVAQQADVAFLQTGDLEQAIAQGVVSASTLSVIHPVTGDSYPFLTSTALYPEWPLVSFPRVAQEVVDRVKSAFINISSDPVMLSQTGIAGFVEAADYSPVDEMLQTLKLDPYEAVDISFSKLVNTHQPFILGLLLASISAFGLLYIIIRQNLSLRQSQQNNKQYLREIETQHQMLKSTFTAMPDLVWVKDPKGVYLDCNTRYESYLNQKRKQIIGKTDHDLFDAEMAQATFAHDSEILQLRLPSIGEETYHFLSDDHEETLEVIKTPILDKEGKLLGLLGIGRDITNRKHAENALRLSNEVFENTLEAIMITDHTGTIVNVNPAFSRITGYSREEAVGQNPSFLSSGRQSTSFYTTMWEEIRENDHWKGELWNRNKNGEIFAEQLSISALRDDDSEHQFYVGIFSDITESKVQQEQLSLMAHYDPLTELPNRTLFADRFGQAILHSKRNNTLLAVCFIDLDNFKPVNDSFGHEMGDRLLVEAAKRLTDSVRGEDTVSRFGGDEFALLLNDISSVKECKRALDRILYKLETPFIIDDHTHYISASIGATLYPSDDQDVDTLLRHADQAMYQAKMGGKHRYHLFDSHEDRVLSEKQLIIEEVKKGIHADEFLLYYQPKVDMVTGHVFGAEALIRWQHPEKGMIPPIAFLPYIDSTDMDIQVGEWVINQAVEQLHQWSEQGIDLEVSVNISSHHLQQPTFVSRLAYALDEYPTVKPEKLQLEVLESSVLSDLDKIRETIEVCRREIGVEVALDDFGTGYSSLTHLRSLAASTVKLDKGFIQGMIDDPNDYMIVDGVISLAESFGRAVIAEGVESKEHGLMLLAMGCHLGQGYGIGRPMPADNIRPWLAEFEPDQDWKAFAGDAQSLLHSRATILELTFTSWYDKFVAKLNSEEPENLDWPFIHEATHFDVWMSTAKKERLFDSLKLAELDVKYKLFSDIATELYEFYERGEILRARSHLKRLEQATLKVKETIHLLYPNTPSAVELSASYSRGYL
jgi:diguanylate cyclase (GGDEF)-like protein/PAS domain S-box-containing protein